jgi:hypothetical protein
MRLDENEVMQEEKKLDAVKHLPGSTQDYDHWNTLMREFLQGNSLDLRGKQLVDVSLKLFTFTQI